MGEVTKIFMDATVHLERMNEHPGISQLVVGEEARRGWLYILVYSPCTPCHCQLLAPDTHKAQGFSLSCEMRARGSLKGENHATKDKLCLFILYSVENSLHMFAS